MVETIDTRAPVSALSVQFGDRFGACQASHVPSFLAPAGRSRPAFSREKADAPGRPPPFPQPGEAEGARADQLGRLLVPADERLPDPDGHTHQPWRASAPADRGRAPSTEKPPRHAASPDPARPAWTPRCRSCPTCPLGPPLQIAAPAAAQTAPGSSRASRSIARRALLCLLNQTRREHGLKSLRGNAQPSPGPPKATFPVDGPARLLLARRAGRLELARPGPAQRLPEPRALIHLRREHRLRRGARPRARAP